MKHGNMKGRMVVALAGLVLALPGRGIDVRVDFTRPLGRDIRRLNGGNLGPSLTESGIRDTREEFASLRIPLTRTHDVALSNPGLRLCDIQMIFGNAKADAADPDNYYFKATDDYLQSILDAGSEILFRLGTSIEHSRTHYATEPMMSNEKWAEVCAAIIRHYNRGWADGHRWNIRYWEIWAEPDVNPRMWAKSFKEYLPLYEVTARRIKREFPEVKVGGPALAHFHPKLTDLGSPDDNCHVFLSFCRERKLPLDFFSWHIYTMKLEGLLAEPVAMRKVLDSHGFGKTELFLDEWHFWCHRFDKFGQLDPEVGLCSANASVHALAALTGWQDLPLDQACFYTIGPYYDGWGAWDSCMAKTRLFHAFRMFAKMLDFPHRVATESPSVGVQVLAGRADDGRMAALVSNFKSGEKEVRLTLKGAESKTFDVTCLDMDDDERRYDVTADPDGTVVLRGAAAQQSNAYLLCERQAR